MARTQRDFRVRVSTRGADSMSGDTEGSGNVDLIFRDADIPPGGLPDSWGGQDIKPLEARVRTQGWSVQIIDKNDQVTKNLSEDFNSSGEKKADLLDRLIDLSSSDDGGTTWSVEATGRVSEVSQNRDNPSVYTFATIDELARLRNQTLFEETKKIGSGNTPEATTTLFPGGIWTDWNDVKGVNDTSLTWQVDEVSGDRVTMTRLNVSTRVRGRVSEVSRPARQVIEEDLKPNVDSFRPEDVQDNPSEGDFKNLRLWVESVDNGDTGGLGAQSNYELMARKALFNKNGEVGEKTEFKGVESRTIKTVSVYWPTNQPAKDEYVSAVIYQPNVAPSKSVPLHFGGSRWDSTGRFAPENGIHPVDWFKKVFDLTGANYNATQLATKKKQRADMPPLWPRVTSTSSAWDNLRQHAGKPFGLVPVVNTSGELEVTEILMPTEDEISDVTVLTDVDESTTAGPTPPDFRVRDTEQVTKVVTKLAALREDLSGAGQQFSWAEQNAPEPNGADMQSMATDEGESTREKIYERHVDEFGTNELNLDFTYLSSLKRGVQDIDTASHEGKQVAEAYLDRYGQGGVWTDLTGMEAIRDEPLGNYVILNVGSYPNLRDQARGNTRLMQVVNKQFRVAGADFTLLDAGPDKQPLPNPSISATVQGPFQIDVTIGGSGGTGTSLEGLRFVIEVARNSTEPDTDSDKWSPAVEGDSQGAYSINGLAPNTTYWIRARQFAEHRISSDWTTAISKTTDVLSAPSGLSVSEDLGCAVRLSWTTGDDSARTEVLVDDTVQNPPEPPEATERFVRDLDPSTSYTFKVRHLGPHGGTSSSDSLSHTTSTSSTGPRTGGTYLLVGERA